MNCLALEQRGEVLLVDCGVTFDDRGYGVDVVHPDFSALDTFGDKLVGVVVTHGHEDHIGALPYLLRRHDVPIWAPRYALGLIKERLGEHEVLAHARLSETRPRTPFEVGSFSVEPVRVTHSIADATALAIRTDGGLVVHSGDFKFDEAPPDGETFDEARLRALGDDGVALLLSDSTNVDVDGPTGNEADVGKVLQNIVSEATGAVVVAMFASNVHRLRLLGTIAERTGRRIVLLGRGVGTHARVARATGYLPWPDHIVLPEELARDVPPRTILAIATGSQGEARAALAKLARGEHPSLEIGDGDTVVFSARTIPGNEREVMDIMALLLRRGCEVRTRFSDRGVHVSGHAHRPDQKRMIELVRPRSFIPVHGTMHHLTRHGELARQEGIEDVAVIENGQVAELSETGIAVGGTYPSGRIHVWAGRELPTSVLRERAWMAEEGVASGVVIIDAVGEVVDVEISTRGVIDEVLHGEELAEARAEVRRVVEALEPMADDTSVAEQARLAIRRSFFKSRGRKPMTIVHVRRLG